jgi:hypothetical protein
MSAGDIGGLLDAASVTPTSSTDSTDLSVDSANVGSENTGSETEITEEVSSDSAVEEGAENKAETKPDSVEKGKELTPQNIRNTIKSLKASQDAQTPEGQATIKALNQIHQSVERGAAYAQLFPKVEQAREAKQFLDSIGGVAQASAVLQSMNDSDELLYSGDPKLLDNIIEDLKSENKLDALGKLAPAFLEKLRSLDNPGYYKAFAPHFLASLQECEVPEALNSLHRALSKSDIGEAKQILGNMAAWFNGLSGKIQQFNRVDPEREKFTLEKQAWEKSKAQERNNAIATEADSFNNKELGKHLASFLKMPFFKGFPRETLAIVGNQLKSNLFNDLKADKIYQQQMNALWKAKSPDKARIVEYHRAAVEARAERIVRETVQRLYPGFARGGSAAGRVAAAAQKREAEQQTAATATAQGKPIYVLNKPSWNQIDWSKDPKQLNFIAGRAWLKGSNKFVTWRRSN